ncbi:MAG TPA: potassium/proton antiporter [Solimonas sp.]|nr:potassium/proton antiporter [Solimonas sp.]
MHLADNLILLAAVLFLASILATVVTPRLGVPLLLVFLVVGMLAGEDGPGGLHFGNYPLANLAGTAALAVILFDGGLRTRMESFRVALRPALSLATLGVLLTTVIVGGFSAWLLQLSLAEGLLIGAIVGSTDAAAVFSLLHTSAVHLNQRVSAALEIESGANDPMAVFMTLALIGYLQAPDKFSWLDGTFMLVQQMGLGALFGYYGGKLLAKTINSLELSESLYPLLALFGGLLIFGLTSSLGGSGFLAAYLSGLVLGNRRLRATAAIHRFHDGIAWLAQIGMFVILGLLVSPSKMLPVVIPGMLIAAVLMLVARPFSVLVSLAPFRFPWREQAYISWVGLRGSVPIVLATYPWLAGLPNAGLFFNIAFFIVLVSLVLQGWTVAPSARLLGLQMPASSDLVHRLEIDLPGSRGHEIVSYRIGHDSGLIGKRTKELGLEDASRIIGIARGNRLIPYRQWGTLREGDYVSLLAAERELPKLDQLFREQAKPGREADHRFFGEFRIDPKAPMAAIAEAYGVPIPPGSGQLSVQQVFAAHLPQAVVGDRMRLGDVVLVVRQMDRGRITEVGLRLPHD